MVVAYFAGKLMIPVSHRARLLYAVMALFASAAIIEAQPERPTLERPREDRTLLGSIRGRILQPDGRHVTTNTKVTLQTLRSTVAIIFSDNQGEFEFPDLTPGSYYIEIEPTNRKQFDVSYESVQVYRGAPSIVTIALRPFEDRKAVNAPGTVSVSELTRDVPAGARKEFEKAVKASQKGLNDQAIEHLRKAIEIYPGFAMAYNDLGSQLLARRRFEEALEVLQRAVELDVKAFNPALNLGITLVHLHRFAEASEALSKALKLEPNSASARLYSGLAYKGLGESAAAERELKTAYQVGGAEYAVALFYLGQIYLGQGDRNLSRLYFERYLAGQPNAENAEQVRRVLETLR